MSLIRQNINNYSLNRKEILHRKDISCIWLFAILGFVAGLKRAGFENYLRDLTAPVDDGERVEVVEGGDDLGGVEKGGRVRELAGAEELWSKGMIKYDQIWPNIEKGGRVRELARAEELWLKFMI